MPVEVFISHSHKDHKTVERLAKFLADARDLDPSEIRCTSHWPYALEPGDDFVAQLRRDIDSCRAILPVLTPNSVVSQFVMMEIGAGWAMEEKIMPVLPAPLPNKLVPTILSRLQRCRLNVTQDLVTLINSLASLIYRKADRPDAARILAAVDDFT